MSKVRHPPNERDLDFDDDNFNLNLSMIGFQCLVRLILVPIGTPKYVKGKKSKVQPKILAQFEVSLSDTPIPNTLDLLKLTFSPDATWKHFKILAKFYKLFLWCAIFAWFFYAHVFHPLLLSFILSFNILNLPFNRRLLEGN